MPADGLRAFVKVRSLPDDETERVSDPDRRLTRTGLVSVHRVLRELEEQGFACPRPLLGPTPPAFGVATVESNLDTGELEEGFDPQYRRVLVGGQLEVIRKSSGSRLLRMRRAGAGVHSGHPDRASGSRLRC